jgi:pyruvate/2-oxoglutarate dehydrogenase complex dihydrolipoamide dehydrogenase (E3) component
MREFDVVVVSGGTAGIAAALAARSAGARVALVEREGRLGGDCTFYGCVPSKALRPALTTIVAANVAQPPTMRSMPRRSRAVLRLCASCLHAPASNG